MDKRKRGGEGLLYGPDLQQSHHPPSGSIQAGPTQDACARSEGGGPRWEEPGQSGSAALGDDDGTGRQTRCEASHEHDDSDQDRISGIAMVDKANKGKAVLSGPGDLGMSRDGGQIQSPEPQGSTQLSASGQDKSSLPTPDSQVL